MKNSTHRLVRTVHLWIGAWGAVAAVMYGLSGFMQNHRAILKIPQGEAVEVASVELTVPEEARVSPQALAAWIASTQHLQLQAQQRGGGPDAPRENARPAPAGSPSGGRTAEADRAPDAAREGSRSSRWNLSGGNARVTYQAQYVPGEDTLTLRTTHQSALAVLSRLHKGVGGGIPWILLSDSFALGMAALGISGLVMWARGRSVRQMVFSAVGAVVVVLGIIGGSAVI